ncbi:tumor protein p53-inducible protein 13 isoform X2 [Lepisosteus oculatus]
MCLRGAVPVWLLLVSLGRVAAAPWDGCDDGQRLLEVDLPRRSEYLCPGPAWLPPAQKLPSIATRHQEQQAERVCTDRPILYNQTIPSSGPHRPTWAQYGEYLYCPPQRWVHNLKHGGVVFLYHPCAPASLRVPLVALARACVNRHIITPFAGLSPERPLAIVSWGRTLEMSHVTLPEASDWLRRNVPRARDWPMGHSGRYSLMLLRAAGPRTGGLGGACPLASLQTRSHRFRAVRPQLAWKEKDMHYRQQREESSGWDRRKRRRKREIGNSKIPGPVQGKPGGRDLGSAAASETEHPGNGSIVSATQRPKHRTAKPAGAAEEEGGTERGEEPGGTLPGGGGELEKAGERKRGGSDTPGCTPVPCECREQRGPARGARLGLRLPTPRTEEAAWAAAALGFLLALLTLAVLHTRLYRHWQRAPSLYWQDPQAGYDSVADVIRRRLKMGGRRKRRATQSRREGSALLPPSSSEGSS